MKNASPNILASNGKPALSCVLQKRKPIMFLTDYIKIYESAMPPDFCDEIIKRFDDSKQTMEVMVQQNANEELQRSCVELNLSKQESMADLQPPLLRIAELALGKYRKDITGHMFPEQVGAEQFRINKYRAKQEKPDRHMFHASVTNYASARRFLSLFWFLNDVEQGGEIFFPHFNIRIQPKKSRLVVFPSLWMYPFSEEEPLSGDRYTLNTFMHYV